MKEFLKKLNSCKRKVSIFVAVFLTLILTGYETIYQLRHHNVGVDIGRSNGGIVVHLFYKTANNNTNLSIPEVIQEEYGHEIQEAYGYEIQEAYGHEIQEEHKHEIQEITRTIASFETINETKAPPEGQIY